jgi:TetR/AcrR family transcriptional regulator, tetracycline repressor protein
MPGNRAPWGTISRDQVVAAATKIVRTGGYEAMTIRSLAADLGVAPMSLYRHVRDKDDILDEVVDRLLARVWRPSASPDDWEEWVTQAAEKLRRFLVTQPAALHVYLQHPVVSPAAISRMNAIMDVLRQALPDEDAARRAYAAIHTYTVGFAALESSRSGWTPTADNSDDLAVQLATYTTPEQFMDGLHSLIQGIQRRDQIARAQPTKRT